jgi:glutathione synthase/RimK-type ligase-like ATP-grasp enzyme
MKIGLCVSNEVPNIKGPLSGLFQKKIDQSKKDWSEKFAQALNKENIKYDFVLIDKDNWIEQVNNFDVLLWKPKFMGVESSQFFKEKVYFIQHIMKKRIFPNYETVWHFDSKIAQKYLFEYANIKSPKTCVSFDYNEARDIADQLDFPTVLKSSNGAGSTGVKLLRSKKQLYKKINFEFIIKKILSNVFKTKDDPFGYMYVQKFMENNSGDLRINIIGDKYAVGFWRANRDNDFRASGSGKVDYDREIPKEIIEYCAQISKSNKFDSMAYDLLFDKQGDFVIVEISYGYVDTAVYNANGYYILDEGCKVVEFIEEHIWPQELWVKWVCNTK